MTESENDNGISVIIPVYNGEKYIGDCISSLKSQTLKPAEILIINDGSTDATLDRIAEITANEYSYRVVSVENGGQGKARNLGLDLCVGKYVLFLDADDFLEPDTLERAYTAILRDCSDMVVFDWKYYNQSSGEYCYLDKAVFFDKERLEGEECLVLLRTAPIFTVNKLYTKSFLVLNKLRYDEGHIYEDVPFWVKVCVAVRRVSLIHLPLYTVRLNLSSTTKTAHDTNLHSVGYLCALEESLGALKTESKPQYAYLYSYFVSKFISYYNNRTPRQYRKEFLKTFVCLMNEGILSPVYTPRVESVFQFFPYRACIALKVFEKKRYAVMRLLCFFTGRFGGYFRSLKSILKALLKRK